MLSCAELDDSALTFISGDGDRGRRSGTAAAGALSAPEVAPVLLADCVAVLALPLLSLAAPPTLESAVFCAVVVPERGGDFTACALVLAPSAADAVVWPAC